MMHAAYSRLFWGAVLVFADIRVNGWDLLPDVIGWVLILFALERLASEHTGFFKARNAAFLLLLFSLVPLAGAENLPFSDHGFSPQDLMFALVVQVLSMVGLYMIHGVSWAIAELAVRRQLQIVETMARNTWLVSLVAWGGQLALVPLQLHLTMDVIIWITILWAILMLFAMVMILRMLWLARQKLAHTRSLD